LLALGIAALVAWPVTASAIRGDVHVWTDGQPFVCADPDQVTTSADFDVDPETEPVTSALIVDEDTDCVLRFVVENRGSADVVLAAVTLPYLGEGAAMPVGATRLDGGISSLTPGASADPDIGYRDARFDLSSSRVVLAPAEKRVFEVTLESQRHGCLAKGAFATADEQFALEVSALGLVGTRVSPAASVSFAGSSTSCYERHN
jgi:hypothetical protein